MNSTIKPDDKFEAASLAKMRTAGGNWFAYQNHDMGHSMLGHLKAMKCGQGCTYPKPPERMPDTDVIGWRYVLVGEVDLQTGLIKPLDKTPETK